MLDWKFFVCMIADTTISSTLLPNEPRPVSQPTLVLKSDQVESVRGRPLWILIFRIFGLVVPALFGYLVYSVSDSDQLVRGMDAFMAMMLCCVVFWSLQKVLSARAPGECLHPALAVQFFFRGASVSILLAVMLESFGMSTNRPRYAVWKDVPIAFTVGFAEEVSKLFVVVLGTFLIPSQLPESLVLNQDDATCMRCIPTGFCVRSWTTLIESPRALAMAGMSVGFGFMFSENLEYFFLVFTTMDTTTRIITMVLRILLNLHPILTGLCAARLASILWTSSEPRSISIGKIAACIWPSVVMHAIFDFGLMFTSTNPDLDELDVIFIVVSLSTIPIAIITLLKTYKRLPHVSPSPV